MQRGLSSPFWISLNPIGTAFVQLFFVRLIIGPIVISNCLLILISITLMSLASAFLALPSIPSLSRTDAIKI